MKIARRITNELQIYSRIFYFQTRQCEHRIRKDHETVRIKVPMSDGRICFNFQVPRLAPVNHTKTITLTQKNM